ncbi:MAG: hypothetical protein OEO79_04915 [Gemmatimonadota bacterium]|nr:hypothetical protein [Gemmatimonadota bacterium]MDH3421702.1 hypothetical protein [Gemmatimonadota bacterium]
MKLVRRRGITVLALLALTGCSYWQGQVDATRDVLAGPDIERVRLTRRMTGEAFVARVAEVRGDSIFGTRGESGGLTCDRAGPSCNLQMPISDVGYIELRRFSAIKTAALVLVPVGAFVLLFLAGDDCPSGPSLGPC